MVQCNEAAASKRGLKRGPDVGNSVNTHEENKGLAHSQKELMSGCVTIAWQINRTVGDSMLSDDLYLV